MKCNIVLSVKKLWFANRCKSLWFLKTSPKLSLRIPTEHFMVRQLQQQWFLLLREWHKILRRIRRQARFRTANERNDEKPNWAPPIHNSYMLIDYAIFFYAWYSTKCHLHVNKWTSCLNDRPLYRHRTVRCKSVILQQLLKGAGDDEAKGDIIATEGQYGDDTWL